jgi:hypothetical protein
MRRIVTLVLVISLAVVLGSSGCSETPVGESKEQHEKRIKARQAHEEARKAAKSASLQENK